MFVFSIFFYKHFNGDLRVENTKDEELNFKKSSSEIIVNPFDSVSLLRTIVPCDPYFKTDKNIAIFVIFGQSNAGNHGGALINSRLNVDSFYAPTEKCYRAQDPLLGSTGGMGSLWTRLGDKLVGRSIYSKVLFIPLAEGGSQIDDWIPGGGSYSSLSLTLNSLKKIGIKPTAFMWQQGESEVGTKYHKGNYTLKFNQMVSSIREKGFEQDIYVTISTVCGIYNNFSHDNPFPVNAKENLIRARRQVDFRNEILSLTKSIKGIYLGPDTDKINPAFRPDGCHLGGRYGQDAAAEAWFDIISRTKWHKELIKDTQMIEVKYVTDRSISFSKQVGRLPKEKCKLWVLDTINNARALGFSISNDGFYKAEDGLSIRPFCSEVIDDHIN